MGISRLIDISRRSLGVYQRALDVTSHNVANANNPDYSRQRVIFGTEQTEVRADGDWGMGVKIDDVNRVRNRLTDIQIRTYNQKNGDVSKRAEVLGQIETLFTEPSALGLSGLMSSFFNSWDELSVTPNAEHLRQHVVQTALKMTDKIKNIYDGFDQVKADMELEMKQKVTDLNDYLKEIQLLNQNIVEGKIAGNDCNDLEDKRDKVIAELSKIVNIAVNYEDSGSVNISVAGVFAVDTFHYKEFELQRGVDLLTIRGKDGSSVTLNSGEINAISEIYAFKIPEYRNKLNQIATTIMESVNAIHSTGYTLQNPPQTGINFFSSYADGKLNINASILNDLNLMAVSANGESGNGALATQIADLATQKLMGGKKIGEFYTAYVSDIGAEKQLNENNSDANMLVLEQLDIQKTSYSGISIDEEMTNVIKFQRSYDASAKLIKVADEILQTIINMI